MKQLFCTMMMLCTLSNVTGSLDSMIPPPYEEESTSPEETLTPDEITSKEVPIFMYHHLSEEGSTSATIWVDTFEEHIKALSEAGVEGVSFQDLIDFVYHGGTLPENPVVITFDDGYSSNYELAFPILEKYNMKATMFVIGISVGKDTYRETNIPTFPHFSFEEAQVMIDSGLISIQSHSYDLHQWAPLEVGIARPSVLQLEDESDHLYMQVLSADYLRSKGEIEKNTTESVDVFSYPGGAYTAFSEEILTSLGVLSTVTVNAETNIIYRDQGDCLYALNRYAMDNVTDIDTVLKQAGVE